MGVKEIKTVEPNQALIDYLNRLVKEAESGELQGIACVTTYDDSCVSHGWHLSTCRNHFRILGALSVLNNEMLTNEALRNTDSVLNHAIERY